MENTQSQPTTKGETKSSSFSSIADILKAEYGLSAKTYNEVKRLEMQVESLKRKVDREKNQKMKMLEANKKMVEAYKNNPRDWWYVEYLQKANSRLERQVNQRQQLLEEFFGTKI